MAITINGSGTVTGLSAGGLPDASVVAADIASSAVTFDKLSTSATESDNVASRTAKAWVNFNGTGTVAIRASFNVSSITDNGTGDYTVNFAVALSNANYSAILTCSRPTLGADFSRNANIAANNIPTTNALRVYIDYDSNVGGSDNPIICVAVFN